jgi:hypothetical protein
MLLVATDSEYKTAAASLLLLQKLSKLLCSCFLLLSIRIIFYVHGNFEPIRSFILAGISDLKRII